MFLSMSLCRTINTGESVKSFWSVKFKSLTPGSLKWTARLTVPGKANTAFSSGITMCVLSAWTFLVSFRTRGATFGRLVNVMLASTESTY